MRWYARELATAWLPLDRDLVEFVLIDGNYGYGRRFTGADPDRLVAIASVIKAPDGWRVVSVTASGC
jgi:hypothetical protein